MGKTPERVSPAGINNLPSDNSKVIYSKIYYPEVVKVSEEVFKESVI
jgi:hypothetical protein